MHLQYLGRVGVQVNRFKSKFKVFSSRAETVRVKSCSFYFNILFLMAVTSACKVTSTSQSTSTPGLNSTAAATFAGGTKVVKIITSNSTTTTPVGSFSTFISGTNTAPIAPTPVPAGFPGSDGVSNYIPGVAATQFYDSDGVTVITKPTWLDDVQLGMTGNSPSGECATFGGSGQYDSSGFFRVSEANCANPSKPSSGTGGNFDPVFIRIVLNRDASVLGTGENLLVQIEYQASAIRLNSDGSSTNPEDNLDQLWKVFWNTSLAATSMPKPFSVFIPPNYASCLPGGSGTTGAPGACPAATTNPYTGAPVTVKQIMIPLSAYPTLSVIQISRIKGRVNSGSNYVANFCASADSPLCLGLVVKSITITRI